ncbi:uncharacterized protein LOC132699292 isoform X2 [Cylas formicarius]|uniref:Odorant binding protein 34 n=1 Tax=Cylas formicarius TaxID=197179 RepID=A0A8T9EJJ9_CYLFO|nr:uncharacterized protein LOC132699292 isoform X2 [Cylas formicarius]UNA06118.1 odorant binding protein 34 [Cylas formicarius]
MKSVICALAAFLTCVSCAPVYTPAIISVHLGCQNITQYFVPNEVFQQLEFDKVPPKQVDIPDNFDDHMYCMYTNLGFESESGELDLSHADGFGTLFANPEDSVEIVTNCASKTEGLTDPIEIAGRFYFCTLNFYA